MKNLKLNNKTKKILEIKVEREEITMREDIKEVLLTEEEIRRKIKGIRQKK